MNHSCEQLNVSPGNNFQEQLQQQQLLQMQHCKIETNQADIFASQTQVKTEQQQFIDLNQSQEYSHVHHTHSSIQAQDLASSSHDYQQSNNLSPGGNNSYATSPTSNLSLVQLPQKPQSITNDASNNNIDASCSLQHQHQQQYQQQSHSYNPSPVSSNGQQFSSATSPSSCAGQQQQQVSLSQPFIKFEKKLMGATQHTSQMKQEGNGFRARVASYSAGCMQSHHHQNSFQSQSVSPQLNSNYYSDASQTLTMLQSGQYSPQNQQQQEYQQQQLADQQQPKQQLSPPPIQLSTSDTMGFGINLEQYISKRNERERSRVRYVNDAFHNLQNILPLHSSKQSKRMSKVEILRSAMSYIKSLETLLDERRQQDNKSLVSLTNLGVDTSISPAFQQQQQQQQQQITFAQQHHQQQHIQQHQVVAHQQVQQQPNLFSNNINNHCQALNNGQTDNNIDSYNNTDNLINYQSQQQQQVSMQQHHQQFIANQNHVLQNHGHQQQFQQHAM